MWRPCRWSISVLGMVSLAGEWPSWQGAGDCGFWRKWPWWTFLILFFPQEFLFKQESSCLCLPCRWSGAHCADVFIVAFLYTRTSPWKSLSWGPTVQSPYWRDLTDSSLKKINCPPRYLVRIRNLSFENDNC